MIGEGIHDGDLLVVDRSLRPASGDVIIACVEISPDRSEHCEAMSLDIMGDFTAKTYRRDKDGARFKPANPDFPVIHIRKGQQLDYFGKVTAFIHRFAGKR